MTVALFEPLTVGDLTIPNRIWVAPMCQYSVTETDGVPADWHLVHLGAFAQGGFGLVLTEATAVTPAGRISAQDVGLWNDQQRDAWRRVTDFVHTQGARIGVQLAHAGRKASNSRGFPGEVQGQVEPSQGGWTTLAPSAIAFPGYGVPVAMSEQQIDQVVADFEAAARRAVAAGFDVIEIHAAHGYLLHEFLSPLSNERTDRYGGSFANRTRLLIDVVTAVRAAIDHTLFVRISATDWRSGGWDLDQSVRLATELRELGVDLIDVSSGGLLPAEIPLKPGYQVDLARRIRREAQVATAAVGLITEPAQAEEILRAGDADAVLLGRAALREPHWPQRAAHELGVSVDRAPYPPQHVRGAWTAPAN